MSTPSRTPPPDRTELETVVRWRLIAVGGGAALLLLGVPAVLACLAALRPEPPKPAARRLDLPPAAAAPFAARPAELAPMPTADLTVPQAGGPGRRVVVFAVEPPPPKPIPELEPASQAVSPAPPATAGPRVEVQTEEGLLVRELREAAWQIDLEAEAGTASRLLAQARTAQDRAEWRARAFTGKPPAAPDHAAPLRDLLGKRKDLQGLPLRLGADCQADPATARRMDRLSDELRVMVNEPEEDVDRNWYIAQQLSRQKDDWVSEDTASTLAQVLQAEREPIRVRLVQILSSRRGARPTDALARLAVFDPSRAVRQAAVEALRGRPPEEARPTLLRGLRYPWPPAAGHAAEAIVRLEDRDVLVGLARMLDQPDPREPFQGAEGRWFVRELVCVNHLRNCLLCHAPSFNVKDPVRGAVPTPGRPLPQRYYTNRRADFVRADVTYLRQDFSVMQPVARPDRGWPEQQRFDYFVRTRELTDQEVANWAETLSTSGGGAASYPQRDAVLFALRRLTGMNAGTSSKAWYHALLPAP